ncbi:hypothetical protein O1611_g6572 [Lasiodiplodia mahajangana]|uniref:Uncharacterized protein n=1 Tax=Lasiodiplodia mahajangana TaxID=1108764 RepID=A0ACC2JI01_9PEZI|nr:hypothetical protein O1611_g6572 [Lasiodiplodia mahajangana]
MAQNTMVAIPRDKRVRAAHAIGAEDPWIFGFNWKLFYRGCAYHPRPEGMVAIADLIHGKMVQLGLASQDQAGKDEETEDGFVML